MYSKVKRGRNGTVVSKRRSVSCGDGQNLKRLKVKDKVTLISSRL